MMENERMDEYLEAVKRLTRDLRNAAITLSRREARFLVDYYYSQQDRRKRSDNQGRALEASAEPHEVISWLGDQNRMLENDIRRALDAFSASKELGVWARTQVGIGPVIAAGLLAHIDLRKCPTVGKIYRFGGYDPTVIWRSTQKCEKWLKEHDNDITDEAIGRYAKYFGRRATTLIRYADETNEGKPKKRTPKTVAAALAKQPWNAKLKTLFWKIGESFVKVSGKSDAVYGHMYLERKAYEAVANERGEYAKQAAAVLEACSTHKQKATYETGKLPLGHLHERAKRHTVKQFLSDYHATGRKILGLPIPLPYPIGILGHAHHRKVS